MRIFEFGLEALSLVKILLNCFKINERQHLHVNGVLSRENKKCQSSQILTVVKEQS